METTINVNEVKKELMKSKVNAKFSHYVSGNLYYTVELTNSVYQFPISTIEDGTLVSIETMVNARIIELDNHITLEANPEPYPIEVQKEIDTLTYELEKMTRLSSDLGTTNFYNEMRGSELNRWITKAIDKNEFIKIS